MFIAQWMPVSKQLHVAVFELPGKRWRYYKGDKETAKVLSKLGIVKPAAAGAEEVRFYDGYTERRTGEVAPGLEELAGQGLIQPNERRVVVPLPSAHELGAGRVFIHAELPQKVIPGVEVIRLPAAPHEARAVLQEFEARPSDLILLPTSVAAGSEETYRPVGSGTPIVVTSATGLEEANPQELAALARIARNLEGQVFRVGLEEWSRRVIDRDRNNLSIQY